MVRRRRVRIDATYATVGFGLSDNIGHALGSYDGVGQDEAEGCGLECEVGEGPGLMGPYRSVAWPTTITHFVSPDIPPGAIADALSQKRELIDWKTNRHFGFVVLGEHVQ